MKSNYIMRAVAGLIFVLCAAATHSLANPAYLTSEHVDLRILYADSPTNPLSLVARDGDNRVSYNTNEVYLVVNESARYELPAGTPFGDAGDPLWILPQSHVSGTLYLGLSSEGIPAGVFNGALELRLISVQGPGHFFLWQADQFGAPDVRMNSRDGVGSEDKTSLMVESHEHVNWGFSSTGAYYITLEASGVKHGETTRVSSAAATFVFHVLPLRPFVHWQSTNWPPATALSIIGPEADPDEDNVPNVIEYAHGLDPHTASRSGLPELRFIEENGATYGAIEFSRVISATDLVYLPMGGNSLDGANWTILTDVASVEGSIIEKITIKDTAPVAASPQRFFRLGIELKK
jgi:surface-anchored protein